MMAHVTSELRETIRLAAAKLTGYRRRQFQAEMTIKYCDGSGRKAERLFGWGRAAVTTGLGELRSGIRCLDNVGTRGRKKTEDQRPLLAAAIRGLVEPESQADPTFQTTLAFTRVTAEAVRDELRKDAKLAPFVPCRQTVGTMLNRMGYRLRPVLKARPQKKFARPTPSSNTSTQLANGRGKTPPACVCRSTPRQNSTSGRFRGVAGRGARCP